jgi:hypothetical protein
MNKLNKLHFVTAVSLGIAIGVCAREVLPGKAHAQGAKRQYMVRGASGSIGGYEKDLNALTADGWSFVGPLPLGNGNPALIFEK